MSDILGFKKEALRLGLCGEYREKWDSARSKEDLMNMALDSKGIDMVADSVSNGWGLSPDYILKNFPDYINGKWRRERDGYTSEMYVLHKEAIKIRSTLTLLVDCECEVSVGKNAIAEIYLCGRSRVDISCEGHCYVICYGKDCGFTSSGGGVVHRKYVENSEPHINHYR